MIENIFQKLHAIEKKNKKFFKLETIINVILWQLINRNNSKSYNQLEQ